MANIKIASAHYENTESQCFAIRSDWPERMVSISIVSKLNVFLPITNVWVQRKPRLQEGGWDWLSPKN